MVNDYLEKQKYTWEVLIANDGSTDNTSKLVRDFAKKHKGFKVLDEPHRGKGGTVIAGMLAANEDNSVYDLLGFNVIQRKISVYLFHLRLQNEYFLSFS